MNKETVYFKYTRGTLELDAIFSWKKCLELFERCKGKTGYLNELVPKLFDKDGRTLSTFVIPQKGQIVKTTHDEWVANL